jgi:septal ring factor EnvC (AmiA/AmiB activator)
MGLGSTAKKLQQIADMAEDVYARLNQLREQVAETRATVDETKDRVDDIDRELAEQRALLEALATERGIDVEATTAEVHVVDAESAASEDADDGDATASDA